MHFIYYLKNKFYCFWFSNQQIKNFKRKTHFFIKTTRKVTVDNQLNNKHIKFSLQDNSLNL